MTAPVRPASSGGYTTLNLTSATNLIAKPAVVRKVIVVVTAATASSVIDSTGTSATAANTILTIPASTTQGTVFTLDWLCDFGLAVVPGAGVTLAVSYDDASAF